MSASSEAQNPEALIDAGSQIQRTLRSYVVGVRPRAENQLCTGTAFLLGMDRDGRTYAVTCLHVVRNYGQVYLWFKPDDQPGIEIPADVLTAAPDVKHDIAVLRLLDSLPAGLNTLALEPWENRRTAFESYGFAQDTNGHFIPDGQIINSVPVPKSLSSLVTDGELLQLDFKNPVPGLSGAPVVLKGTSVAVGMINSGHIESPRHPLKETGYAQAGDVILGLRTSLEIAPVPSLRGSNEVTESAVILSRGAWRNHMRLCLDPFLVPDGARDPHIVRYFWTMPEFSEVLGDPNSLSTMLVFGDVGSGRSSLCKALEDSYQNWGFLTVSYDGGSLVGSDKEISAAAHIPELVEAALRAVMKDLEQHSDQKERFRSAQLDLRQVYCYYVDKYVKDRIRRQRLRDLLGVSDTRAYEPSSLSDRELLKQFCAHTRELGGYRGIVFLIDPHELDTDSVWRVYKSLIESELLLVLDNEPITFRFFFDSRLKRKALAIDWIRTKQEMILDSRSLSWTGDRLRTMLAARLGACTESPNLYTSLTGLAPSVPDLDEIALQYSGGTPYGLITFGNRLLNLLCAKPIDPKNPYITAEVVDQVIQEYDKRRKEQAIEHLVDCGENHSLELKSTLRYNLVTCKKDDEMEREVAQAICGFFNSTDGGTLIIGISDDGTAIGVQHDLNTLGRKAGRDAFERAFDNVVVKYLQMPVRYGYKTEWIMYRDVPVFIVKVDPSKRPVYLHESNKYHYYLRQESLTKCLDTKAAVDHVIIRYPDYRPTS